jgi:hypothetical protein
VLLGLCVFWAATAPGIGELNGMILLIPFSIVVAWLLLVLLIIACWGGRSLWRVALLTVIVPAIPFLLCLLWRLEIASMVWLMHRFPPSRPIFHNDFVDDDRVLLPFWDEGSCLVDRHGHWAWADYDDNVLLVVATGVPEWSRTNALSSGISSSKVCVGDDRDKRFMTLKRTTDALVVVLPDGSIGRFALASGLAKRYHLTRWLSHVDEGSVLREARELLGPDEKTKFAGFLAGYREPKP